jgi:hypothetical protein
MKTIWRLPSLITLRGNSDKCNFEGHIFPKQPTHQGRPENRSNEPARAVGGAAAQFGAASTALA